MLLHWCWGEAESRHASYCRPLLLLPCLTHPPTHPPRLLQGKGCGFVQFVLRTAAERAMAQMNGQVRAAWCVGQCVCV